MMVYPWAAAALARSIASRDMFSRSLLAAERYGRPSVRMTKNFLLSARAPRLLAGLSTEAATSIP